MLSKEIQIVQKNIREVLWFAITTITISGFGDVYSVTFEWRIISAILIIVGLLAILGFVSCFGKTLREDQLNNLYSCNY